MSAAEHMSGHTDLFDVDHLGSDLLLGVLFGACLVAGFGVYECDEAESLALFRLFVCGEHNFFDGTELFEMRLDVLLGSLQSHAANEDLPDLFLFRDLFGVDLFPFD